MTTAEFDKIVDKIKKCLALSESDNENEAALAAARAQELMAKYQIEMAQLREEDPDATIDVIEHPLFGGKPLWHTQLALHIAKANSCACFKRNKQLIVVGTPENVQIVDYFHTYLVRMLRHLMRIYCREFYGTTKVKANIRMSFLEGATETVGERVLARKREIHEEARATSCTALVRIDKEWDAVQNYLASLGLRKGTRRRSHSDYTARSHGREAGRQVHLHDALKTSQTRAAQVRGRGRKLLS